MSVPPLSNTLEGGTNGVEITTANSGGGSGNAFDSTVSGVEGSPFFSNVQARGNLSMRFNYTVAPGGTLFAGWDGFGSLTTSVYFRWYMFIPSLPDNNLYPLSIRTAADASSAIIRILADGTVQGRDAGNNQISAGTVAITQNAWIRLEARCLSSTTVGELEWWLYNTAQSQAASDTALATGAVLGANTDRSNFGLNVTAPVAPYTVYFDGLAVSSTGKIGPDAAAPSDDPPLGFSGRGAGW